MLMAKAVALALAGTLLVAAVAPPVPPPAPKMLKPVNDFASNTDLLTNRASLPGAPLWEGNCAMCHSGSDAKAPNLEQLALMPPAAIVNSLTTGVMAEQGAALSDQEKLHIAEYITRKSPAPGVGLSPWSGRFGGNGGDTASPQTAPTTNSF